MDYSIADESGITFLSNSEDIPVHSTPIKGGKAPLPSTRHMKQFMTQERRDLMESESAQSVRPHDLQSRSAQGQIYSSSSENQTTNAQAQLLQQQRFQLRDIDSKSAALLRKSTDQTDRITVGDSSLRSRLEGGGCESTCKTVRFTDQTGCTEKSKYTMHVTNPEVKQMLNRSISNSINDGKSSSFTELENTTLQKQRHEIQLLVAELKARDHELSEMASSHQQQLNAWEQDRNRLETLDKKCLQYEDDLRKKTMQLRSYAAHMKQVQKKEVDSVREMDRVSSTLDARTSEADSYRKENDELKMHTGSLQAKMQALNEELTEGHAREKDLIASIKIKEKDMSSATTQMGQLSDRLAQLDVKCKEFQDREKEAIQCTTDWRERCENCNQEIQILKAELEKKRKENVKLSEENRSVRQQLALIQKEKGMMEKCKDEVIESMKIKQDRTDSQLKNFRELYERQIKDVALMQIKLDTTKEATQRQLSCNEQQMNSSYQTHSSQMSDYSSWDTSTGSRSVRQTKSSQSASDRDPVETESSCSQQSQLSSGYQSQLVENQTNMGIGDHYGSQSNSLNKQNQPSQVYSGSSQNGRVEENTNSSHKLPGSSSDLSDNGDKVNHGTLLHGSSSSEHSTPVQNSKQHHSMENLHSPARQDGYVIQDIRPMYHETTSIPSVNRSSTDLSSRVPSAASVPNYGICESESLRASYSDTRTHVDLPPQRNTSRTSIHAQVEEDVDKCYEFDSKLSSFLEDLGDIDDNIWDDVQAPSSINFSTQSIETSRTDLSSPCLSSSSVNQQ